MAGLVIRKAFFAVSLLFLIEFLEGEALCPRTNRKPGHFCTIQCNKDGSCDKKGQLCTCDGDCGLSCIKPNMKCGELPRRVRNGRVSLYKSNNFNATYKVLCNSGYNMIGSAVRICRGNSYWDGKNTKCKIRCKDPGTPGFLKRHTAFRKNGFSVGARLQHYCVMRYVLKGQKVLKCQKNGRWSARLPRCEPPADCPVANLPPNSYVQLPKQWKDLRGYGVRYILACHSGYTRLTHGRLICMSRAWKRTSSWQLVPRNWKCQPKSCRDPGIPYNGERKGTYMFNEKVFFTCDHCYKLNGPSFRYCQANGKWTDTQPTCESAQCTAPIQPRNGRMRVTSLKCDGKAYYNCNHGYTLTGLSERTCLSNEKWSGDEPMCTKATTTMKPTTSKPTTTKPTTTQPTTTQPTTTQPTTTRQPAITIPTQQPSPLPHTQPNTPPPVTTSSPELLKLVSLCGIPKLPTEGNSGNLKVIKGKFLRIRCLPQYTLSSFGILICTNHTWVTIETLKCRLRSCSNPGAPTNGIKKGLSYHFGGKVTFSCRKCYQLVGHVQRTCLMNGSWSHTQPRCETKKCPSILNSSDIISAQYFGRKCGSVARYKCRDRDMALEGPRERTCGGDGQWTGREPTCVEPNLALRQPTVQSSNDGTWTGPSSRAVDGNRNSAYFIWSSCAHTREFEKGAWWRVDLGEQKTVAMVVVVNRGNCCPQRLNDFLVTVGGDDSDGGRNNAVCGGKPRPESGEVITIICPRPLQGRYVSVVLPKDKKSTLTLCEVEVYRKVREGI